MAAPTLQDAQIFKERCEDSPGILVLCQGDWRPTPQRIHLLEEQNYYVLTAANGFQDIVDWLPQPRCIGAMFAHPDTVAWARQAHADKVIERFEGVGARFLRTLTQELPYGLHNAGAPFTATAPPALKTVDVVSVFSPVALKRGQLLLESLLATKATAYLFAQSLGSSPELLASFFDVVRAAGKSIEYFYYPFDPYALMRIDGRIVVDGRPIGANNSVVSSYLARARLLVHTSTTEGISNSVMEALSNDVPVLLCEDIRGPLQQLSLDLNGCIFRSAPDTQSLAGHIDRLIGMDRPPGAIRARFRQTIDPFEINRRMVRRTQEWFANHGIPWKGHCLGLFGGVQSKLDLAHTDGEESYRGQKHIYPNAVEAAQCAAFQIQVAEASGHPQHAGSLAAEIEWIQQLAAAGSAPSAEINAPVQREIERVMGVIADRSNLANVLLIGAAASTCTEAFMAHLKTRKHAAMPQVHCIDTSGARLDKFRQRHWAISSIHCHQASTVSASAFPSAEEVRDFYMRTDGPLKSYPLEMVLGWLGNDISEIEKRNLPVDEIQSIKESFAHGIFDAVFINGHEFTGHAELQQVYGSGFIVLACTQTFKNSKSFHDLSNNIKYSKILDNEFIDNGVSAFQLIAS